MTNLEIKIRLEQILAKVEESATTGWDGDKFFECVYLEDAHDSGYTYNKWLDELKDLHNDIIT
jgi:hypothetical protein